MLNRLLLSVALLGSSLAAAQSTSTGIPALPPGTAAPANAITDPLYLSGYRQSQLSAALPLVQGLSSVQDTRLDAQQGRVVVTGASAVDRLELLKRLRAAGLPSGVVSFVNAPASATGTVSETPGTAPAPTPTPVVPAPTAPTPTPVTPPSVSTLPARAQPLTQPHRAVLTGPATLRAGEATLWSFQLTNTGTQAIRLQHGACDVRFEVLNAAGQVVRPDPKDTLCTMQLVITDVPAGQSREVQKIRWDGRGAGGQALPAGVYTLRAVFDGPALIRAADLKVTLR